MTIAELPNLGPFTAAQPHAKGGLGDVYCATDPELNRIVAVKTLQERYADDQEMQRRFMVEAEVTARLEHPGVVPVYRIFHDDRNRPSYAMRFIEGITFGEAIETYHAATPDPIAFRRLLQAFLQICQTIAYAHSRGVIHRDLKPQNVMLGKFGETLVVDWGLAKVVGRPEEIRGTSAEVTLTPSGSGSGAETQMGSAVGTPAFMSPEQAAGRWDVIDHRTDVYGLAAVLYTVLTGRKPLEGENWPELQQRIQRGDFPRPRLVKADVARSLEAICLRGMSIRPDDRYTSASAIAEDVEHWLADEPVSTFKEPFLTRLRRWIKRNRTVVSAAAVMLVTAVAGLSLGLVLMELKNREIEDQRAIVEAAKSKADALNGFLINDVLRQADPMTNPVGEKMTVRELLDKAAEEIDRFRDFTSHPEVEAELRTVLGQVYQNLGASIEASRHYRKAWELRSKTLGSTHPDTLVSQNDYAYIVVDRDLGPENQSQARQAYQACLKVFGKSHPETARARGTLGISLASHGEIEEAESHFRESSLVLHNTVGANHRLTLDVDNSLAVTLGMSGKSAEAIPILRSIVERRRTNLRDPELPLAISNLGYTELIAGHFAEAEKLASEAITTGQTFVGEDAPGTLQAKTLLGYSLEGQTEWLDAEREFLAVLAVRRKTLPATSFDLQRSFGFIARLYAKQERWKEASQYLAELLISQTPDTGRAVDKLSAEIAAALTDEAELASSESLLLECLEGARSPLWQGDWLRAELASRYGDCLRKQGKYDQAAPILLGASEEIAKSIAPPLWSIHQSRKRLRDLYTDWKKPDEASKWP